MINIEVKGVQFSNKGAELMLIAILQQLDTQIEEYNLVLSPGANLPYKKRAVLGAYQKLSLRRGPFDFTGLFGLLPNAFKKLLKRYGIITESDVDVILNASGFSYGDQWPVNDLENTAKEVARFNKYGKPYIVLPQALGPFDKARHAKAAEILINKSRLVFARDEASFDACEKLNKEGSLIRSPDFTALIEPEHVEPFEKKTVCFIPNNKMISKYNHKDAVNSADVYIGFWCNLAAYFNGKGFEVVLLNHEGAEDKALCEQIIAKSPCDIRLVDSLGAIEIKEYIGRCQALVSSRFHGCVSALSQGIPCLATSWSHKYEMLFEEYGLINNVLNYLDSDEVIDKQLAIFINELEQQKELSLRHAQKVKSENKDMWRKVITEVKDYKSQVKN
ncbi:polysaccharide pyruvyl transferase family protein [Pseudoalteromonas sp. JBTF-M23]|uniref:Polysaccharide pyruvyl transferase family protein n=1 Tax=Pseudoalteromonas caenipelagi TaxID=2726988 RepID=A0A849VEW3_9GAMM|nr:polysaccharide pyruvyl transferase family protein [Pseudoalteromonas caenipelagi]